MPRSHVFFPHPLARSAGIHLLLATQFQVWQPPPTSTDQWLAQHGYPRAQPRAEPHAEPGGAAHHAAGLKALSQRTPIVGPPPAGPRATQRQFQAPRHGMAIDYNMYKA